MSSKTVKLGKVALNKGGFKGLTVTYSKTEIVENVPFSVETPAQKYKRPVHKALTEKFNSLREHIKAICKLSPSVELADIEMISVTSNEEVFILSAKVSTFDGKVFAVSTPQLDADSEYSQAEDVLKIIDELYNETMKYLSKKEALDSKQYLIDFVAKTDEKKLESIGLSKDVDFTKMASGEQRAKMIEALQMTGAIVMDREDIDHEAPVEAVAPVKEEKKGSDKKPSMSKVA